MHIASGRLAGVFPTFNTPGIQVSAHFCIAQDGTVEQYVSVDDTAFANGLSWQAERNQWLNPRGKIVTPSWQYLIPQTNPNSYTVSIEHEGWPQDKWTDAMYMANHRLLLWLAEKFNLTITPRRTLIGHNEIDPIDKPNCPGPNVEFERIAQDVTVTIAARKFTWMPINTLAALYRFAQLNNLGYPQTDEFEFTSGNNTYSCAGVQSRHCVCQERRLGQRAVDAKNLVCVTGANGFIGSWIVRGLVERNYRVRAFVRPRADLRNLADCRDKIEIVTGDILTPESLDVALTDCWGVIHTAGSILTHPRDGERAWQMHYTGAANIFDAARRARIERIVYTASIFSLGAGWQHQPADETRGKPFTPRNFRYCDAKIAAQALAENACTAGLPLVFVYPTYCFGPGDLHLSSQHQLVDYLRGTLPAVTDAGINIIDVRDAALGHILALEHGHIGEKYLLTGTDIDFPSLFKRAATLAGKNRLTVCFAAPAHVAGGLGIGKNHAPPAHRFCDGAGGARVLVLSWRQSRA